MGYPLTLALRYLGSKKRAFVSVGTIFAMLGVAIGVAALAIVMSVTGGFLDQFREKVLGVNAHVIVLKYAVHFRDYRDVMKKVESVPGVEAVAPFVINPMMVTHDVYTATGVLLKGVDPDQLPKVLDLPRHITEGSLDGLRKPGAKAPESASDSFDKSGARSIFADGGLDEPSPSKLSLLDAIERQIKEDRASPATSTVTDSETTLTPEGPLAPEGNVTPKGGYRSQLPDSDVLPESIDPDPCRSPDRVRNLPGAVLGHVLAKRLAVGIGDCLQITSPQIGMAYGASGSRSPIAKQFRVIAMFDAGFDQYDSKLVYTDLYEAQAFYEQGDSVTGVEAKVTNIDDAADIAKQVDKLLSNGVYHTMDWRELNHGLFTALLIHRIAMSVVLTLIIVIAAFTVIGTLIMVVLDKKKEIALLKALGASDSAVLKVFVYQGGIIGVVGTAAGLLMGWAGCKLLILYGFPLDPKVYFISKLPVHMKASEFAITGTVALLICLVATVFPALYAARLRPSDGLRSE
jgi:lipoprotein-releasing system permease protein